MIEPSAAGTLGLAATWTSSTPCAARCARAALRRALEAVGLAEDAISDAVLAASELVANATDHASGPYEITLRPSRSVLICEVFDCDPRIPEAHISPMISVPPPVPDDGGGEVEDPSVHLAERGRGLLIVDQLTRGAWGFRLSGDGRKAAWMAIPVAEPSLLAAPGTPRESL